MVAKNKTPEERKETHEYLDSIIEIIERKEGRKLIRDSDTGSPYIYVGMILECDEETADLKEIGVLEFPNIVAKIKLNKLLMENDLDEGGEYD